MCYKLIKAPFTLVQYGNYSTRVVVSKAIQHSAPPRAVWLSRPHLSCCNSRIALEWCFNYYVLHCTALHSLYCTAFTVLYCTALYCTVLCYTVLYSTVLYCTVLYYTILYYTVLYYAILCYTLLYYTILYCNNIIL